MDMKLRSLLIFILLVTLAATLFFYQTREIVETRYPMCGGDYFTAPHDGGIYNSLCIAADGRPFIYIRNNSKYYLSLGILTGVIILNAFVYFKSRKKSNN